jgi:hypothetical protein
MDLWCNDSICCWCDAPADWHDRTLESMERRERPSLRGVAEPADQAAAKADLLGLAPPPIGLAHGEVGRGWGAVDLPPT